MILVRFLGNLTKNSAELPEAQYRCNVHFRYRTLVQSYVVVDDGCTSNLTHTIVGGSVALQTKPCARFEVR